MSLRSPAENKTALTLALFHRNGRGNFFSVARFRKQTALRDGTTIATKKL